MAGHGPTREPLRIAHRGPEERRLFGLILEPGHGDVFLDEALEVVADGDLAGLSPLGFEVELDLLAGVVKMPELEFSHRPGAGGGIDEGGDDGAVPEAHDVVNIDGGQEGPGLLGGDFRCPAFEDLKAPGLGSGAFSPKNLRWRIGRNEALSSPESQIGV